MPTGYYYYNDSTQTGNSFYDIYNFNCDTWRAVSNIGYTRTYYNCGVCGKLTLEDRNKRRDICERCAHEVSQHVREMKPYAKQLCNSRITQLIGFLEDSPLTVKFRTVSESSHPCYICHQRKHHKYHKLTDRRLSGNIYICHDCFPLIQYIYYNKIRSSVFIFLKDEIRRIDAEVRELWQKK